MATKKKPQDLLKKYYEDLESLTPEECALLHQFANDKKKEMEQVVKVMTDMLLNTFNGDFPKIANLRTSSIVEGSDRAPKSITWSEVEENKLPIPQNIFLECSYLSITALKEQQPAMATKLERTKWFQANKTKTSPYIKWSEPIRKILK